MNRQKRTNEFYDRLSDELYAVKIVDELLCLFQLYTRDFTIVDDALALVAGTYEEHPEYPITLGLKRILQKKGWLPDDHTSEAKEGDSSNTRGPG